MLRFASFCLPVAVLMVVISVIADIYEDAEQNPNPKMQDFTVPADIFLIEGDIEYGEYLASECTTCHRIDGQNDGIPGITGWSVEDFVIAMHAYKAKHRTNPVMQLVAGRLNNEDIAALAIYFKNLQH